jgi:2-polyprenyl-6-methoxyphenol hydroxylase-like FAD-dependent oxidoreductase
MKLSRTAAVAGGGIAGLAAGVALLQRGWNVTVYEQSNEVRIVGAGIYIWENGLKVLESLGVYDRVIHGAIQVKRRERRDAKGKLFGFERTSESGRVFVPLREALLTALRDRYLELGGVIEFGHRVDCATAEGELRFLDGSSVHADLVIGADGIHSRVRDGLDLLKSRRQINQFAYRSMIKREPWEQHDAMRTYVCEHWNGGRRLLYAPSTAEMAYVQLTSLRGDPISGGFDRAEWLKTFPHLAWIIDRIPGDGYGDWFETVRLNDWSAGKVALIGDSASAQPPFLGQGGGIAMCSALSLAHEIEAAADVSQGISNWQRREKPFVEWVQTVSSWYGELARVPQPVRHAVLRIVGGTIWLRERTIRVAAMRTPAGS